MAKSLHTLIKLAQHKLEQKQQEINVLTQTITAMQARIEELHVDKERNFKKAADADDVMWLQHAQQFGQKCDDEIKTISHDMSLLEESIQEKQQELQVLFQEKKRYDILAERQAKALRERIAKKAQEQLDDIAQNVTKNSATPE